MTNHLHLLILEDQARDAELIIEHLQNSGFELDWTRVQTRHDFLTEIKKQPDLILADYQLAHFSGAEAIQLVREQNPEIPVIIVSDPVGDDMAVACIKQGAADYLLKDRLARLGEAVKRVLTDTELRHSRQLAAQALRESEERFRRLAENALDIIFRWRIDPPGIEYLSPIVLTVTGYLREEFLADPNLMMTIAHPDDRSKIQAMITGQTPFKPQEARIFHKDGRIVWIERRSSPVYNSSGKLIATEGVVRDITERKLAQARLEASETRYRRLFEAAHDGILILDFETGQINDVNPYLLNLLDYPYEEMLGKTLWELSPFRQIAASREAFLELRQVGYIRYDNLPIETNAGIQSEVEFVSNVYEENGRQVIQCNIRDITERKRAQQALEERASQLGLINDISRQVTSVMDLGLLLDKMTTLIQQSFGYDHVGIFLFTPSRDELLLQAKAGAYAARFPEGHRIRVGQGMIGSVARDGQRLLSNDVSLEPRFYNPFSEEIIRAELDVPIKIGDELLGVLGIQSRNIDTFSENDIIVLETLADQVAIAIHNARLFAAESDQRSFAQALAESAASLNSTLDINEVLNRILETIGRVLPHDAKTIMLTQNGIARVVSHTGFQERGLAAETSQIKLVVADTQNLAYMAKTGCSLLIADTRGYEGWLPNPAMAWIGSSIGAPIRIGRETLGFINLNSATPGFFNQEQAVRLQIFADQAAVAVKNAQLYHELALYSDILEEAVTTRTSELQATTHRVETILNSVGDALFVLGLDGRIQQVNSAFEQQTGNSAAEAIGQDHHELLKLELGSKGDYQMLLRSLKPGKIWHGQSVVLRKDRSTYQADLTLAPVYDEQDKFHLIVVIIRDITLLKEAQRAKDEFVSNVSHELRTPITSIKLNHAMLTLDPDRAEVYIARMGREIDRLNRLIEDLLRLSHLEQGRANLELGRIDLNVLASQFVMDRTLIAESRNISLKYDAASRAGSVIADEGLLTQALSVLITNAVSYTQEGGEVIVSVEQSLEKGKRWSGLRVSDNGPGILPEERSQLFERFFRGSIGRVSGSPGTGLGLTIVKNIIDKHEGRVELVSEGVPGKGTSFTLWLASLTS
jgi:PAS domain S-box-containing protein